MGSKGACLPLTQPTQIINMESTLFDEFVSVSQMDEMQQLCKTLFKDL